MIKLAAMLAAALALSACAPTTAPGVSGATESAPATACTMGLQRCSRYSGQPGVCYDPFQSSCLSGQVCTRGQLLCEKDGVSRCYDPKRQKC